MISAVVLAAGRSTRMGRPKMLMPWGEESVIGHVVSILQRAEIEDIVVVTGAGREGVGAEILGRDRVREAFNPDFEHAEMLGSIQHGLMSQRPEAKAALVCLGDQPQIEENSVRLVCEAFVSSDSPLVVPSYERRRGHPWLIARGLWAELLALRAPKTARDFLNVHATDIHYIELASPSIVQDLDTTEDHKRYASPADPSKG